MAAKKRTPSSALAAFIGFIGLCVVAAVLSTVAVTPALAVTGMAATDSIGLFENLPSYLKLDKLAQATTLTAKNSKGKQVELAHFWAQNRVEVSWDEVSQFVKDATVSVEDQRFYQHGGVDIQGTLRGAVATLVGGNGDVQGGSSITQQYVKNVLVQRCEATGSTQEAIDKCYKEVAGTYNAHGGLAIDRKVQEMKYAIGLEKTTSKDKILLGYLNITGFGGTVYGIEAAAEYYYGVSAKDLSLAQAASLVAIVNDPNNLKIDQPDSESNGKANGYQANKTRRDLILKDMLNQGKITIQQFTTARNTKVTPKITASHRGCQTAGNAAYFCDWITYQIKTDTAFGKTPGERWANFNRGGYTIQTSLDLDLQKADFDALHSRIPYVINDSSNLASSAVGVQPNTGRVLAMVQTKKYSQDPDVLKDPAYSPINYNTDKDEGQSGGFQVGSTFKAFALADWLKEGHSLYEVVNGTKFSYEQSSFRNSCPPGEYGGPWTGPWTIDNDQPGEAGYMTALHATIDSINTGYAGMEHELDVCGVHKSAVAMGAHPAKGGEMGDNPSQVLGTARNGEMSPLTIATAYAGIANNGKWCEPIGIDKITDADGNDVQPPKTTCHQGVKAEITAAMAYALTRVVTQGTASGSHVNDGIAVLGKTGTTDSAEDSWLTESSTKVATSFWIGNAKGHTSLRHTYIKGVRADFLRNPVMHDMMKAANKKYGGAKSFPKPDPKYLYGVKVSVPNLFGKSLSEAKQLLEGIGLGFADGGQSNSTLSPGTVVGSSPGGGASVSKGSVVTVYTSNGRLGTLPDVTGQSKDNAIGTLQSAGFTNISTPDKATTNKDDDGKVIQQSPGAGPADPGQTVTIYIGKYTEPAPPPPKKGGPPDKPGKPAKPGKGK